MEEDILRQISLVTQVSRQDLKNNVDNEVLILLQEELEGMGSCLERFGLPSPDMQNRNIPKLLKKNCMMFMCKRMSVI